MTDGRRCSWCPNPLVEGAQSLCLFCAEKEAMLKEGLTNAPEMIDAEHLERFFWKLAVYAIKAMGKTLFTIEHVRESLSRPILRHMPLNYVSILDEKVENADDMFSRFSYTLKAPIPKFVLFGIVEKLGIWNRIEKDSEPDNFTGA